MSGFVAIFNVDGIRGALGDLVARLPSRATRQDEWQDRTFAACRLHHGFLDSGPQPVWDAAGETALFLDGELFTAGDRSLQEPGSATAACLDAVKNDPASLARFNGSFACIAYDRRRQTMTLVSDRINTRPLYYFRSGTEVVVASHIAALTAHPRCPKVLDRQTLHELIAYRQVLGDNTIYEGIRWIKPGSLVTFDRDSESVRPYWRLRWNEPSFPRSELAEAIADGFRRAVNRRLARAPRHGLFLSGGLDSRMILAAADRPLVCATLGDVETDQVRCARKAAEIKGSPHHFLAVEAEAFWANFEEGVRITSGMYGYQQNHFLPVLDRVREYCEVAFTGNYLDTTLRGTFLPQRKVSLAGVTVGLPAVADVPGGDLVGALVGGQKQAFGRTLVESVLTAQAASEHEDRLRQGMAGALQGFESTRPQNAWNWLVFRSISRNFAFPNVASVRSRMDISIVAWDHDLLDVALQMPPEWACPDTGYRQALQILSPELAALDYANEGLPANTNPYVRTAVGLVKGSLRHAGRQFLNRRPLDGPASWLDFEGLLRRPGPLRDRLLALPRSEGIAACGIFSPSGIETAVDQHLQGKRNTGKFLLMLLTMDNWVSQFGADAETAAGTTMARPTALAASPAA